MPPKDVTGMLSPEMAELLSQKIREMERSTAAETERSQLAQKGKAHKAARAKLKEIKKLAGDESLPAATRLEKLRERIRIEDAECRSLHTEATTRMAALGKLLEQRAKAQGELNKVVSVKNKLESLCRQLSAQTDLLKEERRRATDMERRRRHEMADEYQRTIDDVKKKMDAQANERARLSRENEELRASFKAFFERYDGREKEMVEQQKHREAEVIELNRLLEEAAGRYKTEATREALAERDHAELSEGEAHLRRELQVYASKFSNFQDAIAKSDKVLGQYKRQRNKMQRRVEQLEKENAELRAKSEKRVATLARDRDQLVERKAALQARCQALQGERKQLLEELAKEGAS